MRKFYFLIQLFSIFALLPTTCWYFVGLIFLPFAPYAIITLAPSGYGLYSVWWTFFKYHKIQTIKKIPPSILTDYTVGIITWLCLVKDYIKDVFGFIRFFPTDLHTATYSSLIGWLRNILFLGGAPIVVLILLLSLKWIETKEYKET